MTQMVEKASNCSRGRWNKGISYALFLALCGLCAACASGECQIDSKLGSCCDSQTDCDEGLTCLQNFPGGLCSLDCEQTPCPEGARCIHIISESKGDLGRACLALCGGDRPACRGDYSCSKTSDPDVKVCFPG